MAEPTPEGTYAVNQACVEEVVADKGYHSNEVVRDLTEWGVRTYIAEPERGTRNGKDDRRNKRRCMPIDGGFEERGASVCRLAEGSG